MTSASTPSRLLQVSIDTRGGQVSLRGRSAESTACFSSESPRSPVSVSVTGIRNPVMRGSLPVAWRPSGFRDPRARSERNGGRQPRWARCFSKRWAFPVMRGRTFTDADFARGQRLWIVISDAFAKRFFPNDDPVGQRRMAGSRDCRRRLQDARLGSMRCTSIGPMLYELAQPGTGSPQCARSSRRGRPGRRSQGRCGMKSAPREPAAAH